MTFFVPWFAFLSYSKDRNISPPGHNKPQCASRQ